MKKIKRTEITIETRELLIVRSGELAQIWRSDSIAQTEMVRLEETAPAVLRVERESLEGQIVEIGKLESADGFLLVCLKSLIKRFRIGRKKPDGSNGVAIE